MKTIESYVQEAVSGNKASLERVVKSIQDMVYNLALRMLWHPEDAKDVTQEILIKVVTHLARFEHKSSFKTWTYRLASNEILNYRNKYFRGKLNFDDFKTQLTHNQSEGISYTSNQAEQNLLIQEAKIGCSHAMLQCLDQESRLTYVLGEILDFNSQEAAYILEIKPEAFRKRLSRIRNSIRSFVSNNCGLVNKKNACKCHKRVDANIQSGHINPDQLLFAGKDKALIDSIDRVENEVALFRSNPKFKAPEELFMQVKKILETTIP